MEFNLKPVYDCKNTNLIVGYWFPDGSQLLFDVDLDKCQYYHYVNLQILWISKNRLNYKQNEVYKDRLELVKKHLANNLHLYLDFYEYVISKRNAEVISESETEEMS